MLINRADSGDQETQRFCADQEIPILAEIPDVREVAEAYSKGLLAAAISPHYREGFQRVLDMIAQEVVA